MGRTSLRTSDGDEAWVSRSISRRSDRSVEGDEDRTITIVLEDHW